MAPETCGTIPDRKLAKAHLHPSPSALVVVVLVEVEVEDVVVVVADAELEAEVRRANHIHHCLVVPWACTMPKDCTTAGTAAGMQAWC